jgi:hypothetical protein
MRNALILTGLWLGILVTAYAIVFWGNGIERPLPISVLEQQGVTATESEYTQPDGLFSVSIPMGWQVVTDTGYVEMEDPNGTVIVWVAAEDTSTLTETLTDALALAGAGPEFSASSLDLPAEPWDGAPVDVTYRSDASSEIVEIRAERPEGQAVVLLVRGPEKAVAALSDNLDWIWASLAIPANELQII